MKLRHSLEMRDSVSSIFPKVALILEEKVEFTGSLCTSGELCAAARYLASSMVEYNLRMLKRVSDARYSPLDEVLWREDQAIKAAPEDQCLREKIAFARLIRSEFQQAPETQLRGSRHALANAIRHAWLICHNGLDSVNYRRKTKKDQIHYGPLPEFMQALSDQIQYFPNIDWLHRHVRELDLKLHPQALP
ncbi:hypothetical protein [Pseudomonas sp. AU10]|nr:hypothetical protein [Pseudomonas sp. AU10]